MSAPAELVSIIIPAYHSEATLPACLAHLAAQDYRPLEIFVVDSTPAPETGALVGRFAGACYLPHPERLLPHAARNLGARQAQGSLLVFTDPDIYAPPGWVSALASAHHRHGGVIAGALACHGREWRATGLHLAKFDKWLPGGEARRTDIVATANMLCSRQDFEAVGGFEGEYMLGDTLISWAFARAGIPVWFEPTAAVAHHHTGGWGELLAERYERGAEFGRLRLERFPWSRGRLAWQLLATLLPVRLARITWRGSANARMAGLGLDFLRCSPIVVSGQAAWLAGEAHAYLQALYPGKDG